MSNTIYISDLDGTLLTKNAVLSDFSKNKLQELLEDGLLFTVASARSVVSMAVALHGLKLPLPIVEFNGAFISDLESGRHEIINSIEPGREGSKIFIRLFVASNVFLLFPVLMVRKIVVITRK